MKVAIYLEDGFEEVEAISPIDLLRRAGIEVDMITFNDNFKTSSHHIGVFGSHHYEKCQNYDAIILPGGSLGVQNLFKHKEQLSDIKDFYNQGGLVCAICAAPMILGSVGILEGRRFTCYKGCEEGINGIYTAGEVEIDGNIITARSMLYSIPFGLAIIEKLLGKEIKDRIYKQIEGLNRK